MQARADARRSEHHEGLRREEYYVAFTTPPTASCCGGRGELQPRDELRFWRCGLRSLPCRRGGRRRQYVGAGVLEEDMDGSLNLIVSVDTAAASSFKSYKYTALDASADLVERSNAHRHRAELHRHVHRDRRQHLPCGSTKNETTASTSSTPRRPTWTARGRSSAPGIGRAGESTVRPPPSSSYERHLSHLYGWRLARPSRALQR